MGLALLMVAAHVVFDHFLWAVAHSTVVFFSLLGAVVAQRAWRAYRWFLLGFALSMVAAALFTSKWGPGFWFNHNDLAHVVLMGTYLALSQQLALEPDRS